MRASICVEARLGKPQSLDRAPCDQVLAHDLVHISRRDKAIPDRFRVDDHYRTVLALVQAAGFVDAHPGAEARRTRGVLKQPLQLTLAIAGTRGPRAAGLPHIGTDKHVVLKLHRRSLSGLKKQRKGTILGLLYRTWGWVCENGKNMVSNTNLLSLKDDMVAFIEGHGMRRVPGYVDEAVPSVLWEDDKNVDSWKDLVETAKAAAAPFLTLSDVTLDAEEIDLLLEKLREQNFPDEEAPEFEEAQYLRDHVGKVGFLQLGFVHQGVAFLHETATEWYERYEQLLEAIEEFNIDDVVFEEDGEEEE